MRYGVVRTSPDLPSPSLQRRRLGLAGCDVVLEETTPTALSRRGLLQLLFGLKSGDTVLVHGLQSFGLTTGELARLLRQFHEAGVVMVLVGGPALESLIPAGATPRVLALLAEHEAQRPTPSRGRARSDRMSIGGTANPRRVSPRGDGADAPLTQHQLRFARDMHRRGHSLRAIGLLFRLSPREIGRLLNGPETPVPGEATDAPPTAAVVRMSPRR